MFKDSKWANVYKRSIVFSLTCPTNLHANEQSQFLKQKP